MSDSLDTCRRERRELLLQGADVGALLVERLASRGGVGGGSSFPIAPLLPGALLQRSKFRLRLVSRSFRLRHAFFPSLLSLRRLLT